MRRSGNLPRPQESLMDRIPVFYDERQNAPTLGSKSPSAGKPVEAVRSWVASGLPVEIRGFAPVSRHHLYEVHDRDYVDGVLDLRVRNGFGNRSPEVAASLPWTSGSMLAAARHAVLEGGAACSPTSGFHHARWDVGTGFCTFNGLACAAYALLGEGLARKVAILDLDMHFGDGTEDIVGRRRLGGRIEHYTFGRLAEFGDGATPERCEAWLRDGLPGVVEGFARAGCGVVLLQAGADPHVDDPLGGAMTSDQMRRRDRIVFEACAALGLPVAWNLAGGYRKPLRAVLDLHDATMQECVRAFVGGAP